MSLLDDIFRRNGKAPKMEAMKDPCKKNEFAKVATEVLYKRILQESCDHSLMPESVDAQGFETTVYSRSSMSSHGLIDIIIDAMINRKKVHLKKSLNSSMRDFYVFEESNEQEAELAPVDHVEIDFTNFLEAEAVYSLFWLMQEVIKASGNGIVLSQAIVLKISDLSQMIHNEQNLRPIIDQITQFNDGIRSGRTGFIDSGSSVESVDYNSEPAEKTKNFILDLISGITGTPRSFVFGEVKTGLGSGDDGDNRRLHAATKRYFFEILSPVLFQVYSKPFGFKKYVGDLNDLATIFALIEQTELISDEQKQSFIKNYVGLFDGG